MTTMVAVRDLKAGMIVVTSRCRKIVSRAVILRDATTLEDGSVSYVWRNPGSHDCAAVLTRTGKPAREFELAGWSKRVQTA